jgi:hypothetical protein
MNKRPKSSPHIPLPKAILWIVLSVLIVSGTSGLALLYYHHIGDKYRQDAAFRIVAIVQTTPEREGLKTVYLAELLELSIDQPKNLYSFNTKEALQKVLRSPLIKEAAIRKISPGTIHIDYTMRKPIAFLGDYSNTALDSEGVPFPVKPFFTPKKLPEIYLGLMEEEIPGDSEFAWGKPIRGKQIDLAFALLNLASLYCCDGMTSLSLIDLSRAFSLSCGQRQIVVGFEEKTVVKSEGKPVIIVSTRILRLSPDNYRQQLANYLMLRPYLEKRENGLLNGSLEGIVQAKPIIVDLRLSDLAFIASE